MNELTLLQRAQVALGSVEHEKPFREQVEKSKGITEIRNEDAREECHRAQMVLRSMRTSTTKAGKDAREDAKAFANAVISEENRLIGIIHPEEMRLKALKDNWDAEIEAEMQRKVQAEKDRIEIITNHIAWFTEAPIRLSGRTSKEIASAIENITEMKTDDGSFAEFEENAQAAKRDALTALNYMLEATIAREAKEAEEKKAQEAEAERIRLELEELAKLRKQEQERKAKEDAERAELEAQRAELERQRQELEAQKQEVAKQKAPQIPTFEEIAEFVADLEEDSDHIPAVGEMTEPTLKLGAIKERLGFALSEDFLKGLGFEGTKIKGACLFQESDFPKICQALINHIARVSKGDAA